MRAQPVVDPADLTRPQEVTKQTSRSGLVSRSFRQPKQLWDDMAEAASRESMSISMWMRRVLVEATRNSASGWRSVAPGEDRKADKPEPREPASDKWPTTSKPYITVTPSVGGIGSTWTTTGGLTISSTSHAHTDPHPLYIASSSGSEAYESKYDPLDFEAVEDGGFTIPDEDLPEP